MVKRIIILTAIYALLIAVVTLTMSQKDDTYLIVLLVSGLTFSFLLLREIYKKYIAGFTQKNNTLNYTSVNSENLNKISRNPFLFGFEKRFIDGHEFYFDDENLYAITRDNKAAIFKLRDITEVSKTAITINNGRIWQIKISHNHEEFVFKFAHNYTIWNKNFLTFYEKIKAINPSAIQSEWNVWNR